MSIVTRVLLLVAALLAISTAVFVALPAVAEGEITIVSDSYQNKFPNEILFKLEAKGVKEIKNITHYYNNESRARDLLTGAAEAVRTESSQLRVNYTRPMKIYVYDTRSDMVDA